MSILSIFSIFGKKPDQPNNTNQNPSDNGIHLSSFVINHTGMAKERYYMLQKRGDGIYFKYSDLSPLDWRMHKEGEQISDKDFFQDIDTVKNEEDAKSYFITENRYIKKIEQAIAMSGAIGWNGKVSRPATPGLTDTGDSYLCYFQLINGQEIHARYNNVKPKGWDAVMKAVYEVFEQIENPQKQANQSSGIDDKGLTILVDYCKKRVATVGGDGYSEIVLYKNESNNTYQLHTYEKYGDDAAENHHAFQISEKAALAIVKDVEKQKMEKYVDKNGIGMCGAVYVLKFKKGDKLLRISTDNLPADKIDLITNIGDELYSNMGEEIMP